MATEQHVKKFVFASQTSCGNTDEKVEIYIPEVSGEGFKSLISKGMLGGA